MKPKKIELVLKQDGYWRDWDLYEQDGCHVGKAFCEEVIDDLFDPGHETCIILEITAHPAEWTGGDDD